VQRKEEEENANCMLSADTSSVFPYRNWRDQIEHREHGPAATSDKVPERLEAEGDGEDKKKKRKEQRIGIAE
jgi:hypothetical protein